MQQKNSVFSNDNLLSFQASSKQLEFLSEATYNIKTPAGNSYSRNMELIAYNALTGNMLVREKVSYQGTNYQKVYILSKEGKPEKYGII